MFIVAYFLMFRRMMRRWSTRLIAFWGVVWVLGVVVELFGGAALARFDALGLDDEERFLVYGATLRMIRDHPWFGTGLGTFPWAFPAYRPPEMSIWGIWEQAHSTPLELFAELGIPLGLLVSFAWFSALAVLAYGSWVRRRDLTLPIGALCFAAIGLVQSSVDFSMQVPGYTIVLFALAGSGLAQSFSSRRRGSALA
jgi:O-antigen ligase